MVLLFTGNYHLLLPYKHVKDTDMVGNVWWTVCGGLCVGDWISHLVLVLLFSALTMQIVKPAGFSITGHYPLLLFV